MSKDDNIFKNDSPWGSPSGGGGQGRGDGNGSGQRRQPPNIDDLIRTAPPCPVQQIEMEDDW